MREGDQIMKPMKDSGCNRKGMVTPSSQFGKHKGRNLGLKWKMPGTAGMSGRTARVGIQVIPAGGARSPLRHDFVCVEIRRGKTRQKSRSGIRLRLLKNRGEAKEGAREVQSTRKANNERNR